MLWYYIVSQDSVFFMLESILERGVLYKVILLLLFEGSVIFLII